MTHIILRQKQKLQRIPHSHIQYFCSLREIVCVEVLCVWKCIAWCVLKCIALWCRVLTFGRWYDVTQV